MGLAAFVFFVVPWMAVAGWMFLSPRRVGLAAPAAPWRPLTDYPPPATDQRSAAPVAQGAGSEAAHDGKHEPLEVA